MTDTEKTIGEKAKLFDDLYSEIIPQRIPIDFNLSSEVYIANAGLSLGQTMWTLEGLEEAMGKVVPNIKADILPKDSGRLPLFSQISGSVASVMSETGFMQHPETTSMQVEEYDAFIASPYDFIIEKLLQRLFPKLTENPYRAMLVLHTALQAKDDTMKKFGAVYANVSKKFGFYNIPGQYASRALAPLDIVADHPRGFTGMSKDLKRCPEKVIAAAEAVLPMLVQAAKPAQTSHLGSAWMPGHMPTFMRTSEFEKFYYPTFSKLIHATAENGQAFKIFCEDDWTRYFDYLQDLPQGTRFIFEYGDPKLAKEKLGKKHILSGFYPITLLKTGTKEQCVDKAKELIDILAPGGNYYFNFDKTILTLGSIKLENLYAVIDYVHENGTYTNAGQRSTVQDKKDTIKPVLKDIPKFKSKYYISAEQYRAENKYILPDCEEIMYRQVQQYEDAMFKSIMGVF
ncbi:MAG: uroporphyrinogen decarboxylase [Anaerofustis sp.]